jgi:hypothetical protein
MHIDEPLFFAAAVALLAGSVWFLGQRAYRKLRGRPPAGMSIWLELYFLCFSAYLCLDATHDPSEETIAFRIAKGLALLLGLGFIVLARIQSRRQGYAKRGRTHAALSFTGMVVAEGPWSVTSAPWNQITLSYISPERILVVHGDRVVSVSRSAVEAPAILQAMADHGIEDLFNPRLQSAGIDRVYGLIARGDRSGAARVISEIAGIPESAAKELVSVMTSDRLALTASAVQYP